MHEQIRILMELRMYFKGFMEFVTLFCKMIVVISVHKHANSNIMSQSTCIVLLLLWHAGQLLRLRPITVSEY